MKRLFLFFALMMTVKVYAQDSLYHIFPVKDGKVYYDTIVYVKDVPASLLFTRAQAWAIGNFKATRSASQVLDREGGVIAFTSYFDLPLDIPLLMRSSIVDYRKIWATLQIYVRDGKARIIISDAEVESLRYMNDSGLNGRLDKGLVWKIETFNEYSKWQRLSGKDINYNMEYFRRVNAGFRNLLSFASAAFLQKSVAEF